MQMSAATQTTAPNNREDAATLLACSLTFRDSELRGAAVPVRFASATEAQGILAQVLLHEARESMNLPLETAPADRYLHPVDIDSDSPGIVDDRRTAHVLRGSPTMPRMVYQRCSAPGRDESVLVDLRARVSAAGARASTAEVLRDAEKAAASARKRQERSERAKEKRNNETQEERSARLDRARAQRRERDARKEGAVAPNTQSAGGGDDGDGDEDGVARTEEIQLEAEVDASIMASLAPLRRARPGKLVYFQHPLPHHRHLTGLQFASPRTDLLPALLRGEPCESVHIIRGPPGTGKTREIVARLPESGRVLLCAPTNVGASNLFDRCMAQGVRPEDVALVLAPNRVPPGFGGAPCDPARRVVCTTVSARSGPLLVSEAFDTVLLDEAAQCMEAWVWTLLRPEVRAFVMAGDTGQLPALVSESGTALAHDRSLMHRLLELGYKNVTDLVVQNRMAPELLAFPNRRFYGGQLRCGPLAPPRGSLEVVRAASGAEEACGPSFRNACEALEALRIAQDAQDGAVIITPYAAQVQLILSHRGGREVHTVDSFQGKEAKVVVLSVVRDGSAGSLGFWSDDRRLCVALTRARERLVVVASTPERWPACALRDLLLDP